MISLWSPATGVTSSASRNSTASSLVLLLASCARAGGPLRVVFDPELISGGLRVGALSPAERAALSAGAQELATRVRVVVAEPALRSHFRRVYRLDPAPLLDRGAVSLVVRAFPPPPGGDPARAPVGGYQFGESSVDVGVRLLLAARDPAWREDAAGIVIHELAHLADFLEDGENDDGGMPLDGDEEGDAAQRAAGCPLAPPGALGSLEELRADGGVGGEAGWDVRRRRSPDRTRAEHATGHR